MSQSDWRHVAVETEPITSRRLNPAEIMTVVCRSCRAQCTDSREELDLAGWRKQTLYAMGAYRRDAEDLLVQQGHRWKRLSNARRSGLICPLCSERGRLIQPPYSDSYGGRMIVLSDVIHQAEAFA